MYYIRKIRNSVLVYSDLIIILKVNNGNPAIGFESTPKIAVADLTLF